MNEDPCVRAFKVKRVKVLEVVAAIKKLKAKK
jgi:hypothetical protein